MATSLVIAAIAACGDDRTPSASGFAVVTSAAAPAGPTGGDGATVAGSTSGDGAGGETSSGATAAAPDVVGETSGASEGGEVTGLLADVGGMPRFDLGVAPDGGAPEQKDSCRGVDLLFVVDDSGSMKEEQANLIASFPGFVAEMEATLADVEGLHIGIVTTDAYEHNEPPCDHVLGALVTKTGGLDASKAACGPYATGRRFMSEADDLAQRFSCAGQVGTSGNSVERPIAAAVRALGPALAGPGQCNAGFHREDALLVLVIVTDEEDEGSGGGPVQWYEDIVALKGGIESNVVVLALIGPQQPACADAADIAYQLETFAGMFTHGSVGQICAETYQPFFHDSIAAIAEACEEFTPPG